MLLPRQQQKLARGANDKEHAMSQPPQIAVICIDIGKNAFHVVATMNAARLCCVRSGRVVGWRHGLTLTRFANRG